MKLQFPFSLPVKKLKLGDSAIGLDIGFHSIKMAEIIVRDEGIEIVNFGLKEIKGSPKKGQSRADFMGGLIKQLFAERKVAGKKVYISVSGHNVVIRRVVLPKIPEEELKDAIKWEAKKEVLFSLDDADVDYHITGEVTKDGADFYELLTVMARADIVPFMMEMIHKAGLKPQGVTVVPMALWAYDRAINTLKPDEVTSYIDMGAERTRVYFVADDQLLFSREIPSGSKNITSALIGEYETEDGNGAVVDEQRAEDIKKSYGLPSEDSTETTEEGILFSDLRKRILPIVTKQVEEFYRSIEYFKNKYKRNQVHRLIVSGGGVGLHGLYQFLTENLDMNIERCNALFEASTESLELTKEEAKLMGPGLTAAAGLAIGRCAKINIMPDKYRGSLQKTLVKFAPLALLPFVIVGMYYLGGHLRSDLKAAEKTLVERRQLLENLQSKLAQVQGPKRKLQSLGKEERELRREKENLPGGSLASAEFGFVFDELEKVVGKNTSLYRFTYTDSSFGREDNEEEVLGRRESRLLIDIKGHIFGDDLSVQTTLQYLLEDLKKSPAFQDVKLLKSDPFKIGRYTSSGIEFELRLVPRTQTGENA
jgi:type IV pilus assembly protein PilM